MKKFLLLFILTIELIIGGKTMAKEVLTENKILQLSHHILLPEI